MDNEWTIDEYGISRFLHAGWKITRYPGISGVYIDASNPDVEVYVDKDGITCFGEEMRGFSFSGVRFTIPWRIVTEIAAIYNQTGSER